MNCSNSSKMPLKCIIFDEFGYFIGVFCGNLASPQVHFRLATMNFSFYKPDFIARLSASCSMMKGNVCVSFLILGNRNWLCLVVLLVIGLTLT
jgi:hypothetical protein